MIEKDDWLYVIAGTYSQAADFAAEHGVDRGWIKFISEPKHLRMVDGRGKTLFVVGMWWMRDDISGLMQESKLRGFIVKFT